MSYMTANCPFCGDKRPAELQTERIPAWNAGDPPEKPLFFYECVCCAAQGPYANDQASALRRWNFRGIDSKIWLDLANRENGTL